MRGIFTFMTVCLAAAILASGCAPKLTLAAYTTTKTEYLNTEEDGSLTVRSYGSGRNRIDARAQAMKNAVSDVLFSGVYVPSNPSLSKPVMTEVNARERHKDFFDNFFRDGGEYKNFVSCRDRKYYTNVNDRTALQNRRGMTLRVERAKLRLYLIQNGIIKEQ